MEKDRSNAKNVLVGVLKQKRDLLILLNRHWYRIPVAHAPRKNFRYLAFYEPARFGSRGQRISYYAKTGKRRIYLRKDLLPDEPHHEGANRAYLRIRVDKLKKLSPPIINKLPRRVSFGYTTLPRLLKSKNMLELYNIAPTEEIIAKGLRGVGIKARRQYWLSTGGRKYCLDFAIFLKRGQIAIECDNSKAHSGLRARQKDKAKDAWLRSHGWTMIRLREQEILADTKNCIRKVQKIVRTLNGN